MKNILILRHIKKDNIWYWQCPICDKLLNPHEAGKGKGHQVLQSKGTATKHLMSHNIGYVPKRIPIYVITSKNQYYCNKCEHDVMSKNIYKSLNYNHKKLDWKPEHKFFCFVCTGWIDWNLGLKTKDEVHKGKT